MSQTFVPLALRARVSCLSFLVLAFLASGCGYCGGAFRLMRAQRAELYAWPPPRGPANEPLVIAPDERFRINGDGPKISGAHLLALSNVSEATWFLLNDTTAERVPSSISADSGGHMCRNGVGFNLEPTKPLTAGRYTLVLLLSQLKWPLVERGELRSYRGGDAIVRHYVVTR